jgi:putative phosphoesterase
MTRIVALSDTHLGREKLPEAVVELAAGADLIIHAGDFVSEKAYELLSTLGTLEAVRGNADSPALKRLLPERKVIELDGIRIGLVHMASHGSDLVGAQMMAREMDVQVLVFGHIHRPVVEKGDRLLICPGSPTQPRMSAPSAAMLEITGGRISGSIVPLGSPVCDYIKYANELARESPDGKSEKLIE